MKFVTSLCIAPALLLTGTAASDGPEKAPRDGAIVEFAPAPGQDGVNFTAVAPAQDGGTRHVVIVETDDEGKRELRMKDGTYRVIINGREIERPEVVREGDRYIVRGPDGDEITTFEYLSPPALAARERVVLAPGSGDVGFFDVKPQVAQTPPVMLGISMDQPDEALRYHLGLGDDDAILITRVVDDSPASAAGLKRFDVIASIDGSDSASPGLLHDALMKSEPGDRIKLKVLRGGKVEWIEPELAAYDAKKLASGGEGLTEEIIVGDAPRWGETPYWTPRVPTAPTPPQPFVWHGFDQSWRDMVHEQLRKQLEGKQLDEAQRAIEEALRGMEFDMQPGVGVFEFRWDGEDHKLVIPKGVQRWGQGVTDQWGRALRQAEPRIERHTEEAEKRFEEIQKDLEARMDRLAERLEHLTRLLEERERD